MPRSVAFEIPDLIRTKINLLPEAIKEVRTVEIVGLDLQADGGNACCEYLRGRQDKDQQVQEQGWHQQEDLCGDRRLMRYLHPVQAHESFVASGDYLFAKDGRTLGKTESWTIHELGDGSKFVRVDSDAREEEGKSLLAELLISRDGEVIRFDLRYENDQFEGGIRTLSATYSLVDQVMQVGYRMNGALRSYLEREIAPEVLLDIPLLVMRGRTLFALSECRGKPVSVFVPMFEHAQLFPGGNAHCAIASGLLGSRSPGFGQARNPDAAIPLRR